MLVCVEEISVCLEYPSTALEATNWLLVVECHCPVEPFDSAQDRLRRNLLTGKKVVGVCLSIPLS